MIVFFIDQTELGPVELVVHVDGANTFVILLGYLVLRPDRGALSVDDCRPGVLAEYGRVAHLTWPV